MEIVAHSRKQACNIDMNLQHYLLINFNDEKLLLSGVSTLKKLVRT